MMLYWLKQELGTKRATDMPEDEEDVSDEYTTTSSNALTANVENTTDDDDDDDNDETKYSKSRRKRGATLTDDSMNYDDDQNATLKPPPLGTTQAVTGLCEKEKRVVATAVQIPHYLLMCYDYPAYFFVPLSARVSWDSPALHQSRASDPF
ncbi:hypothetical protein PsorP6_000657 [Peronosclerospora sorghi]|uniref:Uncharacterized protein n=1 Tax=Peronosclerospora sorghi TaxID=230839 RepID=A0ACC0WRW0_9STRA|nr:hypothetical protein PsorP6_000657 [Peronosclerospora sorghi]